MTIWLLAAVLLASLGALGFRQGAVRVAGSCIGILLGALLAPHLGKFLKPVLGLVGIKNPVLAWLLGPFIVFIIFSVLFKVIAYTVHHKIDVFYKYRAGDLRLALWERLNQRLGLCLGLLNGAIYFVLICFVIYAFSYWTVQMSTEGADPKPVAILNRMGQDLHSTGFAKVTRAIDGLPDAYYQTGDVAGLVYNNSLLEARLARYPGFLALGERPEFQDLANDAQFTEMRQRREPIRNVLEHPKAKAIIGNPDLLKNVWATLVPDLQDLRSFLETGKSPKYDSEKILGRWKFDVNAAMALMRKAKPNIPSSEMQKLKKWMTAAFDKTSLVAMTDKKAILKNLPPLKLAAGTPPTPQTLEGQWKDLDGGKYQLNLSTSGREEELFATVEGERMLIQSPAVSLAFERTD
jgi:hypothetical protein